MINNYDGRGKQLALRRSETDAVCHDGRDDATFDQAGRKREFKPADFATKRIEIALERRADGPLRAEKEWHEHELTLAQPNQRTNERRERPRGDAIKFMIRNAVTVLP